MYRIDIFTLFPQYFDSPRSQGVLRVAEERGALIIRTHDFRHFGDGGYRRVDDRPFGGGPGMLLRPEPPVESYESVFVEPRPRLIVLTPQGVPMTQRLAEELAKAPGMALLCGHYEGFDERMIEILRPLEVSLGDYVLSGGEPAALVLADAVVRLLPGVLGDERSVASESFSSGLLDYPQFTRPIDFRGLIVPPVLRSGNHRLIDAWRKTNAQQRTLARRPDLVAGSAAAKPGSPSRDERL